MLLIVLKKKIIKVTWENLLAGHVFQLSCRHIIDVLQLQKLELPFNFELETEPCKLFSSKIFHFMCNVYPDKESAVSKTSIISSVNVDDKVPYCNHVHT